MSKLPPLERVRLASLPRGLGLLLGLFLGLPAGAEPVQPFIGHIFPAGGQRGQTVEVTVAGTALLGCTGARVAPADVMAKVAKVVSATSAKLEVTVAPDAALGEHDLRVYTPGGASNRFRFIVGQLPEINEKEPNDTRDAAQRLDSLPVLVNAQIMQGDRDCFRFTAKAGADIVCDLAARAILPFIADAVPGWFDAVLTLYDAAGHPLQAVDDNRLGPDPVLIFKAPADGEYVLEVTDTIYRGRGDFVYRLRIGQLPYVSRISPLGGPRGSAALLALTGVNLLANSFVQPIVSDGPNVRSMVLRLGKYESNPVPYAAGETKEVSEAEPNDLLTAPQIVQPPITVNGCIDKPGDLDCYGFAVKAKEKMTIEVMSRRVGTPLDSILTLYNARGGRLAENDDWVDPDSPLLTHHADSRITYTFPADGYYEVGIRDVQGRGGVDYCYRLTFLPPRPDFSLRATPDNPRAAKADSAMITVIAARRDGFDGDIDLGVTDLPAGFIASPATIYKGQESALVTISAPAGATAGMIQPLIRGTALVGRSVITHRAFAAETQMQAFAFIHNPLVREIAFAITDGGLFGLSLAEPPKEPLEIPQGGEATINVKVARVAGFKNGFFLHTAAATNGINVKGVWVTADKEVVPIVMAANKGVPVGRRQNIVLIGETKVGKEAVSRTVPAIPIKIGEPKPEPAPTTAPTPEKKP